MSVSTALSRVTGFVRTWAIAYALGVTALAASYGVANNIPNMVYELVAGGVLSSLFIPVFLERWEKSSDRDAWSFASSLLNLTTLALSIVAVLGTVFAEAFVRTQTFRISVQDARLATYFFRFFAVQIVFYGVGAIMSGVLHSRRRYLWPAVGPVFNNVVVIITLLGFYVPFRESRPDLALAGLAVGTTLGVLAMFLVQIPSLVRLGIRYSPRIDLRDPGLRRMGRMAVPTVIYVVSNLVAVSFRNAYAFEVSREGPATLLYAWMFYQLPYGVLAVALATAIFTELADHAGREDWSGFKATFASGFRATGMLMLPMAALLVALSKPIVTLYRAGEFAASDVPAVAEVLVWWGIALFFFAAYMFVLKTFYSLQDTRTPMIVNVVLTVAHVTLYATLTIGLGTWKGLGLRGIPVSDAVFYAMGLTTLTVILRRRIGGFDARGVLWMLLRVCAASIVGGGAAYGLVQITPGLPESTAGYLLQLVGAALTGLMIAYGTAAVLRVPEVSVGVGLLRRAARRVFPKGSS